MKSVFTSYSQDITHLISDMDSGRLAIPDIQRDYVWDTTKVRDLFDSLYKGYPIGYIMLWDVTNTDESRSIGVNEKNLEAQNFYNAFGFKTIGIRKKYYKDGSNALLQEKKLLKK